MREQVEPNVDCCDSPSRSMSGEGHMERNQVQSRRGCAFQRLIDACKRKNLDAIRSVVEERPELVNQRDRHNRSLLHYAAILLLETSAQNNTVQMGAKSIECFNYLLSLSEAKLWLQQDLDGLSTLHLAVISSNVPLVRHIVFDCQPNSSEYPLVGTLDNESHSPLHWAVITNSLESVKILIEFAGIKLAEEADLNGATPLHYATQTRDYPKYRQQLRLMLKRATESSSPSSFETAASTTIDSSSIVAGSSGKTSSASTEVGANHLRGLEILEFLAGLPQINLELKDKDQRTPLLWAASSGNRDAILLLVSRGANLASCDSNRLSALHCAASHGFTDCLECLLNLAKNGSGTIHVNQPDNLSCTPLFYAVLSGNIDCVETLVEKGANLDWQDSKGRTAAHFAALKGQLNSLKLLHERRANLWLANKQGDLPLHYAIKSGRQQVARWLLEHSPYEHSVNAINNFGRSPIHLAVMKNNLEMAEYLIGCGANLNQLVKVRDKGKPLRREDSTGVGSLVNGSTVHQQGRGSASYRYETALDMAARLNQPECLKLLKQSQAQTAAQVIRNRINGVPGNQKDSTSSRSLFDLQTADNPSPIGFETSCSSASPATDTHQRDAAAAAAATASQTPARSQVPPPPRPAPESLLHSDESNGSSALSQSSLTSLRGLPSLHQHQHPQPSPLAQEDHSRRNPNGQYTAGSDSRARVGKESDGEKPYSGGITYNNEHVSASIKYKLYDSKANANHSSFPPLHNHSGVAAAHNHQRSAISAPTCRGQEIVTNVNVYTSPCPHCIHHHPEQCLLCNRHRQPITKGARSSQPTNNNNNNNNSYSDDTSSGSDTSSEDNTIQSAHHNNHLPRVVDSRQQASERPDVNGDDDLNGLSGVSQIRGHLRSHLPPSQNFAQHLPVIMSDQEQSNSPTSNDQRDSSPTKDNLQSPSPGEEQIISAACSPAEQEPRFDRSDRARNVQRHDRYREQVRSPVGEYIRGAPLPDQRSVSLSRASDTPSRGIPRHVSTYSQVRPKVDTRRLPEPAEDVLRSKSVSTLSGAAGKTPEVPPSRSLSRQTVLRGGRIEQEVDDAELTTRVEQAIRKYRQEKRLFEELQHLKQSQIRSGRANEALLVKRLADHFRQDESLEVMGLEQYRGPYSYESYERFLYDQLRKLSQSNCAKLSKHLQRHLSSYSSGAIMHDYLEEDLAADWELRRVIDGGQDEVAGSSGDAESEPIITPEASLQQKEEEAICVDSLGETTLVERELVHSNIGEEVAEAKNSEIELEPEVEVKVEPEGEAELDILSRHSSASSSSRRSSMDVERERVTGLPLRTIEAKLEDQADELSASIIVDALGNVSRAGSARYSRPEDIEEEKEEPESISMETVSPSPTTGRRRSVVNIGNKLEVIYHDIGIEIDTADSGAQPQEGQQEARLAEVHEQPEEEKEEEKSVRLEAEREEELADQQAPSEIDESKNERTVEIDEQPEKQADNCQQQVEKGLRRSSRFAVKEKDGENVLSSPSLSSTNSGRRGSSPPAYRIGKETESDNYARLATIARRASLGKVSVSSQTPKKKVFSGYDLDEMHHRRSPRVIKSDRKSSQHDLQVSSTVNQRADSSSADSSMSDTQGSQPVVQRARQVVSPNTKRRLARSKLLKGRYRPKVALELIRRRWQRIKAEERRRLRQANDRREVEFTFGSGEQAGTSRQLAKSQPSLEREQVVDFEDQANYTLLYELNKSAQRNSSGEIVVGNGRPVAQWCHRKALRIVDVRTLKRTLSLPDSVIYSNNLLRRFDILKL